MFQPRDFLDPYHDLSAPERCFLLMAAAGIVALIGAIAYYKLAV